MPTIQEVRKQYPQYSDMSDEQLAKALHGKYYSDMPYDQFAAKVGIQKSRLSTLGGLAQLVSGAEPTQQERAQLDAMPSLRDAVNAKTDRTLVGLGRGLLNFGEGVKQLGMQGGEAVGLIPQGATQDYTKQVQQGRDEFARTPYGQSGQVQAAEFLGEVLPYTVIPGAAAGASLPVRIAAGSGAGGAAGATQFVPEGGSRAQNTGLGATFGGLFPLAAMGVNKVVNAATGRFKSPSAGELLDLSRQHNVRLQYPDIRPGPISNKIGTALEQTPLVGTGGQRVAQHAEAKAAAQNFVDKYSVSDDIAETAKKSLLGKANRLNRVKQAKYSKAARVADQQGELAIDNTVSAIDDIIQKEQGRVSPDSGLIEYLQSAKTRLGEGGNNFSRLTNFQDDIQQQISSYYKGQNAIIGGRGVGPLQQLKRAMDDDLEKGLTGDAHRLWKEADSFMANEVAPFRESVKHLKEIRDPDELYRRFMNLTKRQPSTVYKALGPDGRRAIRAGIVDDAWNKAINAEGDKFSPAKFAQELERRQKDIGVFFRGADKKEIDGFMKLMRHAERAGQFMENPPTGMRNLSFLMGAGTAGGLAVAPGATGAAYGGAFGTKLLFTTEAGKRFLLASSKMEPGSPQFQKLLNRYGPLIAAEAGLEKVEVEAR